MGQKVGQEVGQKVGQRKIGDKEKVPKSLWLRDLIDEIKRREREVDFYIKSLKIYIKSYQNYQNIK